MRSAIGLVLLATALGCRGGDEGLGSSAGESNGGSTGTTGAVTSSGSSTGEPSAEKPDCAALDLPGDPADLALTPRPERDAEVLALSLEPARAVAVQARYEVVAADLAAIRALAPALAGVHADCQYPDALQMWFWDGPGPRMLGPLAGTYHGWDCHHEAYGAGPPLQIDGIAFKFSLAGVYSDVVRDAYAALPWFEGVDISRCWYADCLVGECEPSGSIALTASFAADGALDVREYTFASPATGSVVYRVEPGQAPALVE